MGAPQVNYGASHIQLHHPPPPKKNPPTPSKNRILHSQKPQQNCQKIHQKRGFCTPEKTPADPSKPRILLSQKIPTRTIKNQDSALPKSPSRTTKTSIKKQDPAPLCIRVLKVKKKKKALEDGELKEKLIARKPAFGTGAVANKLHFRAKIKPINSNFWRVFPARNTEAMAVLAGLLRICEKEQNHLDFGIFLGGQGGGFWRKIRFFCLALPFLGCLKCLFLVVRSSRQENAAPGGIQRDFLGFKPFPGISLGLNRAGRKRSNGRGGSTLRDPKIQIIAASFVGLTVWAQFWESFSFLPPEMKWNFFFLKRKQNGSKQKTPQSSAFSPLPACSGC